MAPDEELGGGPVLDEEWVPDEEVPGVGGELVLAVEGQGVEQGLELVLDMDVVWDVVLGTEQDTDLGREPDRDSGREREPVPEPGQELPAGEEVEGVRVGMEFPHTQQPKPSEITEGGVSSGVVVTVKYLRRGVCGDGDDRDSPPDTSYTPDNSPGDSGGTGESSTGVETSEVWSEEWPGSEGQT